MKNWILGLLLVGAGLEAQAQDMIIFKDKTVEEVKVIEVAPDVIKYKEVNAGKDAVIFTVEKDYIKKVVFESGRVIDMTKRIIDDKRIYAGQRDRALKIDVAGISNNYTFITYEQSIDPSTSWEAGIIFVGAGFQSNFWGDENAMGAAINMGYKFKRSPNFYMARMRYDHILRGAYIKPNLFVSTFNYDRIDYDHPPDPVTFMYPTTRETAVAGSLQLDFGNQLVFSDQFLVDYAFGIGYGFTTKDTWNLTNYGFYGGLGSDFDSPYTYSFTLRIGYLMKK